jgi:poly-gamma-glutamate synthesis protein (capsule biosynthesis protein)
MTPKTSKRAAKGVAFLAGGDVAINRASGRGAFGRLAPLFRRAGAAFVNLELPLSRRGRPAAKEILLRGAPGMAAALSEARFDLMGIANNHILDYGEEALADTLDLLEEGGFAHTGAGANIAAARRPALIERGGLRIGLLAYSSIIPRGFAAGPDKAGINPLRAHTAYRQHRDLTEYPGSLPAVSTWAEPDDLARTKRDIRALKKRADIVIVNHHWGTSMTHAIQDFQTEIARATVDAGADLVLGGHPHLLQGIEFHRGVPIVYSMGNLIFDFKIPFFTEASKQTFLFGATLTKSGAADTHFIPCWSGDFEKPRLLSPRGGEGKAIADLMRRLSAPFGSRIETEGGRVLVKPGK